MARPKKAPRDRLQITLPKPMSKKLRAFARKRDSDISAVVAEAVSAYMRTSNEIPPETAALVEVG